MTKVSVILLLIILAALAGVRSGNKYDPRAIVLIVTLGITVSLFAFMSPIKKCTTRPPRIMDHQGPAPIYIADVLLNPKIPNESPTHLNYGSDTTTADFIVNDEQSSLSDHQGHPVVS